MDVFFRGVSKGWQGGLVFGLGAVALLLAAACSHVGGPGAAVVGSKPTAGSEAARGAVGRAYAGLTLRDNVAAGETVISWIYPGPLKGDGFNSPHLKRGDVLRAVDGRPLGAEAFRQRVKNSRPGDILVLTIGRSDGPADGAVPASGKITREEKVTLVLGDRADWAGPLDEPTPCRSGPGIAEFAKLAEMPAPLEEYLLAAARQNNQGEPVESLRRLLDDTRREKGGFNALSRVESVFQQPFRLAELCRLTTDPLARLAAEPEAFCVVAARNLDLAADPVLPAKTDLSDPGRALAAVADRLAAARQQVAKAFAAVDPNVRQAIPAVLTTYMKDLEPFKHDPPLFVRCLRASMAVDFEALLAGAAELSALAGRGKGASGDAKVLTTVPRAVRQAVKGTVLAVLETEGGWVVYGGPGENHYNMSRLAGVIDAGGNDVYIWESGEQPNVQVIVDFAGDDRYQGGAEGGPAAACLGLALLVDHAGNDHYQGGVRSCGSGLFGVGMLVDDNGADEYRADKWSIGAGFYGAGAVLDLGTGNDVYWAADSSEGLGGPRGFGLIFDAGGNDLYRANGPTPSAYGTTAVFYGLSQGVGFGIRGYDTGGIGIIEDRGGNDRYEAGEFSQGGGYFWGLGILNDRSGNDLYYGDRYGQGFGCHQAAGALIDHAGNDVYWAECAADQGSAWDIAVGLLLDKQGDDTYRADGLAQGSAAMQGIGWLVDLAGTDRYLGSVNDSQGLSRGNSYHYERTKCRSWSVLLDAGGGADTYSNPRTNNQIATPALANDKSPADAGLHGLFIDTDAKITCGE